MSVKSPEHGDTHVGGRVRLRRTALGMSQANLAGALGITFQQVQKYEKGTNRISASRLQHIANILQVPIPYFFQDLPQTTGTGEKDWAPSPDNVVDFVATVDGLSLTKSFMRIKEPRLRRAIVNLVKQIAGDDPDRV